MINTFLQSVHREFHHYKNLGEKAIAQMPEDKLFWTYNDETNSVAVIVQHLWGNMLSRWTDFLTTDGEKEWRHRDAEFENELKSKKELMEKWDEGWYCLFAALAPLTDSDLDKTVYIRSEAHTVLEAINRQVAHYASHVGQIVMLAKMHSPDWTSLSIPKNKSREFTKGNFSKG